MLGVLLVGNSEVLYLTASNWGIRMRADKKEKGKHLANVHFFISNWSNNWSTNAFRTRPHRPQEMRVAKESFFTTSHGLQKICSRTRT
jgi:hypothetical protein